MAWDSLPCRIALLRSLRDTRDAAKLPILNPLLVTLSNANVEVTSDEYLRLIIEAFDKSAGSVVKDRTKPYWNLFMAICRRFITSGKRVLQFQCFIIGPLANHYRLDSKMEQAAIVTGQIKHLLKHIEPDQKVEFITLLVTRGPKSSVRSFLVIERLGPNLTSLIGRVDSCQSGTTCCT